MSVERRYVMGFDSALARTGIAIIENSDGKCRARTHLVSTAAQQDKTAAGYWLRIETVIVAAAGLIPTTGTVRLALIEAPALEAEHGYVLERATIYYNLVGELTRRRIPTATIAPSALKKWAVGHGGSPKNPVSKSHTVAAMRGMWPDLPCVHNELRHHECEALAMAHACAQHLRWPVPTKIHHPAVLSTIKWPTP